ncbi:universal stress protein [Nocardia sp. alder85J]|uniref:universal stress protein n=1 Tax=Nocardia sp. alder85J TaxID=2862949 RepID=UPI001CD52E2D|nr:universal stress protein [Nocardia sp. alder85J]MCX4092994.1 universal stress protein [Nocardia sp. alder85J]
MTNTSRTPSAPDPNPPIVVGVDGSASSYQAVAWAAVDAALYGCPLHLVDSVAIAAGAGAEVAWTGIDNEWLNTEGERVLAEATRIAQAAVPGDGPSITTDVTFRHVVTDLVALSKTARLVVVGDRGLGAVGRGVLGSVGSAVMHHAHCPVAIVHATAAIDPVSAVEPVVVGVDGTANSVPALEIAFEEASRRKVGLTAVHAWSDMSAGLDVSITGWDALRDSEDAVFAESLAGWSERYPDVEVRRILARDHPTRALLEAAERAQLVVVGSHGRGGFAGMLIGSTSNALAHAAQCPIVIVRHGRRQPEISG